MSDRPETDKKKKTKRKTLAPRPAMPKAPPPPVHKVVELPEVDLNMRIVMLEHRIQTLADVLSEAYLEAGTLVRDQLEKISTADREHRKAVEVLYGIAQEIGQPPSIADVLGGAKIDLLLPEEEDDEGDEGEGEGEDDEGEDDEGEDDEGEDDEET